MVKNNIHHKMKFILHLRPLTDHNINTGKRGLDVSPLYKFARKRDKLANTKELIKTIAYYKEGGVQRTAICLTKKDTCLYLYTKENNLKQGSLSVHLC